MPQPEALLGLGNIAMIPRAWITLLVLALIGSNVFWLIKILDAGISYTYQGASLDSALETAKAAVAIANLDLIGLPKEQAFERAKSLEGTFSVFDKSDGCIYVSEVCILAGESGVIREVRYEAQ